jgi:hypothetical protein
MAKLPGTIPAGPLQKHVDKLSNHGAKAKFAKEVLRVTPQRLNNWLIRGFPLEELNTIAKAIGTTRAGYLKLVDLEEEREELPSAPPPPPTDELDLLRRLTVLWPSLPPTTRAAIFAIANDVTISVHEAAKNVIDAYYPGKDRASATDVVLTASATNQLPTTTRQQSIFEQPGTPSQH